eukprot:3187275-Alexandrium_andersonii.AAC.1
MGATAGPAAPAVPFMAFSCMGVFMHATAGPAAPGATAGPAAPAFSWRFHAMAGPAVTDFHG